jgi:ETC complex I subunit-like protein
MTARIYQRAKSSMQAGRARARDWILEFEPAEAKRPDPLTGWAGSGDVRDQVILRFDTLEAARAYAGAHDIETRVVPATEASLKLKTYADNFSVGPVIPVGEG